MEIDGVVGSSENQEYVISHISPQFVHKLTHQTIIAVFIEIKISKNLPVSQKNVILLASENELGTYPVPKLIDNYLIHNCKLQTTN